MPLSLSTPALLLLTLTLLFNGYLTVAAGEVATCSGIVPMKERSDKISITEFGGVGNGVTLNTKAFKEAIDRIKNLKSRGGTVLYIPPGVYLTGPSNLTSDMTLYLAKGAIIKATRDTSNWPVIDPLPYFRRGSRRYMNFIHGDALDDVIITGENGTIDGQGDIWWNMWKQKTLQFSRPSLVEFKNSENILISNVVFQNSPFWNIHPVFCSNVVVRNATILAPASSPNTDGIDPDSSTNVCIEDSYISTGNDLVAVKSGLDEYGSDYGRPSTNITIRRITGSSPFAGIAIGSETSGGVNNVLAEHINLYNVGLGIHVKTNVDGGGFVRNITFSDVYMDKAKTGIEISSITGEHPDYTINPQSLPFVKGITLKSIWGENVLEAGVMQGIKNAPFTGICLTNVTLHGVQGSTPWKCSDVSGAANQVSPLPCSELTNTNLTDSCSDHF